MAVSLQRSGGQPNEFYKEFFCDTVSDIATLPTMTTSGTGAMAEIKSAPMESTCYVITGGAIYILGSSGWVVA